MPIHPVSGEIKAQPINDNFSYLESKLALINGGPKETFNTLNDLKTKYPQGADGIYVVLENGNFYFWNSLSNDWESGGKFQTSDTSDAYFSAENVIKNGDFANGMTGYSIYGGTGKVEANTLKIIGNGTLGGVGAYTATNNTFVSSINDKIYFKTRVRVTNTDCKYIRIYATDGTTNVDISGPTQLINLPSQNLWYDVSQIFNIPEILSGKNLQFFILSYYQNATDALNKQIEIFRPLAVNLTKTFGESLIPTTEEVEYYLLNYQNNWFDGNNLQFVSVKDVFTKMMSRNYVTEKENKYNVLDDFTISDWQVSSDNATLTRVSDIVVEGKKSFRLDATLPANTPITVDRLTASDWDLSVNSKSAMIRIWIEDVKNITNISLYLGNEADVWGNYCRIIFSGGGEAQSHLKNGWNYLSIIRSDAAITNNFDFDKPIKKVRLYVLPKNNSPIRIVFDSLVDKIITEPKLVITFDDGWKTVPQNAFPIMQERGIRGSVYAIGQYVDNPNNPLSPFFMSVEEYKMIKRENWHIGNHTWQHNYYFGGGHTPESYLEVLNKNRKWLIDNDLGDGGDYVCYPNGEYDQRVINLMKVNNYKSARAAKPRGNHPEYIDDYFQLISQAFSYTTTVAQAKIWIDKLLENGGTLFLQFHSIPIDDTIHGPDDPSVGYQNKYISFSKTKFTEVMDYIVAKGLVDNCYTHQEWFERGF